MLTSLPWVIRNLTLIALLMKCITLSGSRQASISLVMLRLKFRVPKARPGNISNIDSHRFVCAKNTHTPLVHPYL